MIALYFNGTTIYVAPEDIVRVHQPDPKGPMFAFVRGMPHMFEAIRQRPAANA